MSPLIAVAEHIAQARQMDEGSPTLPWSSFADFFKSRIYDRALVSRLFLTYYDDDRQFHCTYSYAEFGTVVQRTASYHHDQIGLRRGEPTAPAQRGRGCRRDHMPRKRRAGTTS